MNGRYLVARNNIWCIFFDYIKTSRIMGKRRQSMSRKESNYVSIIMMILVVVFMYLFVL